MFVLPKEFDPDVKDRGWFGHNSFPGSFGCSLPMFLPRLQDPNQPRLVWPPTNQERASSRQLTQRVRFRE